MKRLVFSTIIILAAVFSNAQDISVYDTIDEVLPNENSCIHVYEGMYSVVNNKHMFLAATIAMSFVDSSDIVLCIPTNFDSPQYMVYRFNYKPEDIIEYEYKIVIENRKISYTIFFDDEEFTYIMIRARLRGKIAYYECAFRNIYNN